MRPAALVALLLLGLAQGASGAAAFLEDFNVGDAIKGVPGMMRNNFHTLTTGTQALWRNRKVAAVLRKKHKSEGAMPTYPELLLLRKSADDTQKLIQAGMVYLILPEALPAMLYFFPNCLPSTFESETRRGKRYDTLLRLRTKAVLDLAVLIDSDAAAKTGKTGRLAVERAAEAERVLRASSLPAATAQLARYLPPATSAQVVEVDKAPLKGMPGPFLKAGCTLIGLSGTLPDFIRRRELKKHLRHVIREDQALSLTGVGLLARHELLDATFDRGLGAIDASDAELRSQLTGWLKLVNSTRESAMAAQTEPKREADPTRIRIAAMAVSAVSSTRSSSPNKLPRLLYSKSH